MICCVLSPQGVAGWVKSLVSSQFYMLIRDSVGRGPAGGADCRTLTDVPRTTHRHDTVGDPEDIALGEKNRLLILQSPKGYKRIVSSNTSRPESFLKDDAARTIGVHAQQQILQREILQYDLVRKE